MDNIKKNNTTIAMIVFFLGIFMGAVRFAAPVLLLPQGLAKKGKRT